MLSLPPPVFVAKEAAVHEPPQPAPEMIVHSGEAAMLLRPLRDAVRLLEDSRATAQAACWQVGT